MTDTERDDVIAKLKDIDALLEALLDDEAGQLVKTLLEELQREGLK